VSSVAESASQRRRARLHDRLEDRGHIGGGAGDDTQDLAGRGLLLERLGQIAVADVQLVEEAHVLDGDDGLVGEGPEQLDVAVGEGAGLGAEQRNGADGHAIAQDRDGHGGAKGGRLRHRAKLVLVVLDDVGNVHGGAVQHGPPGRRAARGGPRPRRAYLLDTIRLQPVLSHEVDLFPIEAEDEATGVA
jgi:hypothetical protein